MALPIDYRYEDKCRVKSQHWCHLIGLNYRFHRHQSTPQSPPPPPPPKKKKFNQEMHLKISFLTWGLKLSNSKPCCWVKSLHFFVKSSVAFWHSAHPHNQFFQYFLYDWTPFYCWKANQGLRLWCNFWTPENDPFHNYSLWDRQMPSL
jgi:hypothetical protein